MVLKVMWGVLTALGLVLTWSAIGLIFWPGLPMPFNWPVEDLGLYTALAVTFCIIVVVFPTLFHPDG